jgi:hypothetical protein
MEQGAGDLPEPVSSGFWQSPSRMSTPRRRACVEPGLEQHTGGRAVDPLQARGSTTHPSLIEPTPRFDRAQALVDELHLEPRGIGQTLREIERLARRGAARAGHVDRITDQDAPDLLTSNEVDHGSDEPQSISAVDRWARRREHAELVGDGAAGPSFARVEREHA